MPSSIVHYSGEHCIFGRHCFTTSRHCTRTAGRQRWLEVADTVGNRFHKWHSHFCRQRSTANQHGWLSDLHVVMMTDDSLVWSDTVNVRSHVVTESVPCVKVEDGLLESFQSVLMCPLWMSVVYNIAHSQTKQIVNGNIYRDGWYCSWP